MDGSPRKSIKPLAIEGPWIRQLCRIQKSSSGLEPGTHGRIVRRSRPASAVDGKVIFAVNFSQATRRASEQRNWGPKRIFILLTNFRQEHRVHWPCRLLAVLSFLELDRWRVMAGVLIGSLPHLSPSTPSRGTVVVWLPKRANDL
jgi:hypothetical protein